MMEESERLQRCRRERNSGWDDEADTSLAKRISRLLNHPKIDEYCLVDAYYYDFSEIPDGVQERLQIWGDCYLIFGITTEGEIVSKWIDRWDLNSDEPIIEGKVIRSDEPQSHITISQPPNE